ncbi:MAG: hypothetical protein ABIH41_06655 [Nanoarchaeota archaeon]
MKPLKDLTATYGSKEITDLVGFANQAPVELPESARYHFEKEGSTVHVYGVEAGIKAYRIGEVPQGMTLRGIQTTQRGVEIDLELGGVERIVLHSRVYQGQAQAASVSSTGPRTTPQSRPAGEYHGRAAESRLGQESRRYPVAESRTSASESRPRGFGRRATRSGESRGGESR